MFISSNIKYLRTRQRMTQTDLAVRLGKTSAAVSDYENGKATPPLDVVLQISDFFHVSLDELVIKNLQTEEILSQEGLPSVNEPDLRGRYAEVKRQLEEKIRTLERLNRLQEQRVYDLEWIIRKHAPELAREIGLLDREE